jgi:predicted dehydrogenase
MTGSGEERTTAGFAVAGLGKMGIMHASMLKALPGAGVAALVDVDSKLCRQVQSMGVDAPAFASVEAMLAAMRPQGVVVATPQFLHRPLVEACLERGVPVFCEKPLAHTLEDAAAILAASRRCPDAPLAVGFQMAHNPLFQRAAQWIAEGAIGTVKSFKAGCRLSQVFSPKSGWTFTKERAGGGVLINSGCHLLYTLTMLLGRPAAVTARGCAVHNAVEDAFGALIEYPGGVWGMLEVTWSVPGHELQTNDIEVIGTEGSVEVGVETLRLWRAHEGGGRPAGWTQLTREETTPRAPFTLSPDYCGDEFYLQMQDFAESIRDRRAPRVGVDQAYLVQEMLAALYEAMETGARTPVPPDGAAQRGSGK